MVSRLGVPQTRVRGYLPAGLRPFQCAVERSEKPNKSEKIKSTFATFRYGGQAESNRIKPVVGQAAGGEGGGGENGGLRMEDGPKAGGWSKLVKVSQTYLFSWEGKNRHSAAVLPQKRR
jgi:hypothetical protein